MNDTLERPKKRFKPGKPNPQKSLFFFWMVRFDGYKEKYYSFFDTDNDSLTADRQLDRMCYRMYSEYGNYEVGQIYVNNKQGYVRDSTEYNLLPENVLLCTMHHGGKIGSIVFTPIVDQKLRQYISHFVTNGTSSAA